MKDMNNSNNKVIIWKRLNSNQVSERLQNHISKTAKLDKLKKEYYRTRRRVGWLLRNFLLASNCNLLTFKSPAVVLSSLSPTWQPLDVPYSTVTLNLLQPLDSKRIKSPLHKIPQMNFSMA